ncbi:hypothetical protein IWW37_002432 [Coemansia sp. RSA 2050]|nr:hypothetical protein IWW37_002432 [Coemansia sp. RSA 2050]
MLSESSPDRPFDTMFEHVIDFGTEDVHGGRVYLPNTIVDVSDEQALELEAAIANLEELEDIFKVFCNVA